MQETQETQVGSLGGEYPLELEMATHSSILAWENPWIDEPGRLQSMGLVKSDVAEYTHSLRAQKSNLANNHPPQVIVSATL